MVRVSPATKNLALRPLLCLLLPLICATAVFSATALDGPKPAAAAFSELEGVWEGQFVGYDAKGTELYRIHVRQEYRTIDGETQRVDITDAQADGTVVTGQGVNTARRLADGSLKLSCTVVKSTGERVEHEGTIGVAPDGGHQWVWHSRRGDHRETFRETVRREGNEWVYAIDGVGHYGDALVIMAGRYRKVGSTAAPRLPPEVPASP